MILKIGTRDSKLAVWQSEWVASQLAEHGIQSELVYIKTEGDLVLDTPLPLMGGKGVFTKALDEALIKQEIDIAVHSFKDVPTLLSEGMTIGAVCTRHDVTDALVVRKNIDFLKDFEFAGHIASSSTRRRAQWLHRYPNYQISDIRGNVQTRLRKLDESNWDGVIFASAGLERLGLHDRIAKKLDWMVPAPAQGAVAVACMESNQVVLSQLSLINDKKTALCTHIERQFLNVLEAGCSAPVGALATFINDSKINFHGVVLSSDGSEQIELRQEIFLEQAQDFGKKAAQMAIGLGAERLLIHD